MSEQPSALPDLLSMVIPARDCVHLAIFVHHLPFLLSMKKDGVG